MDFPLRIFISCSLGLALGSFANCLAYRRGVGASVISPSRSFCPQCRTTLSWLENIPLVSYCLQRGRCAHCGNPIGLRYPLTELVMLCSSVALAFRYRSPWIWALGLMAIFLLVVASGVESMGGRPPSFVPSGLFIVAVSVAAIGMPPAFIPAAAGAVAGWGWGEILCGLAKRTDGPPLPVGTLAGGLAVVGAFLWPRAGAASLIMCIICGMFFLAVTGKGVRGRSCSAIIGCGCLAAMLWS